MGLTIWKFELTKSGNVSCKELDEHIAMPCVSRILRVGRGPGTTLDAIRGSGFCIWAMVDPSAPTNIRKVSVRGTGHDVDDVARDQHIGTIFDGPYVWHFFIDNPGPLSVEGIRGDLDAENTEGLEDLLEEATDEISQIQGDLNDLDDKVGNIEGRVDVLEDTD